MRSFRSKKENFHTITLASEEVLNLFLWTRRLQFWKSCFTVLLKVQVFSAQSAKLIKKQFLNVSFSQFLFSTHVYWCFDTPGWRNLLNNKEIAQSPKMIPKTTKLFRERNHFSSNISSESAVSCYKNPKKIFSTEGPTFFISKYEEGWNILQFFKKWSSSKSSKVM